MMDIQTHILPGFADGPQTIEETIQIAQTAADHGIDTIIAAPHVTRGTDRNESEDILGVTEFLTNHIHQQGIALDIRPGQHILMDTDVPADLEHGLLLGLNETKYVLLELPADHLPPFALQRLFDVQMSGYVPVIAHPETHPGIREQPGFLYDMVKNGALIQTDAASLSGNNGKRIKTFTRRMLNAHLVHLLASNTVSATTDQLAKVYQTLDESTAAMLRDNSEQLVHNRPIAKDAPSRIETRGIGKLFR
ncbi:tyrosine-protein phosphatase [Lentibacillus halophilus]|uniref:Tyrosine-protein phosphatase n=1 Tax=Lentibacillus halophilus TaxID=295065 RepID=A0ABP3J007_9BACI